MFASFSDNGSFELAIQVFKLERVKSAKISELSSIILVGILLSCVAFDVDKFFISFKKNFLSINWKSKRDFESHFWFVTRMLGSSLYLTKALITGSRIFSQIWSSELNCGILRFLIMLLKKSFNILAVYLPSFIILTYSINVIFSLEMTSLDTNGFTALQNVLLSQMLHSFGLPQ